MAHNWPERAGTRLTDCAILNEIIARYLRGVDAPLETALDRVGGDAPDEPVEALRRWGIGRYCMHAHSSSISSGSPEKEVVRWSLRAIIEKCMGNSIVRIFQSMLSACQDYELPVSILKAAGVVVHIESKSRNREPLISASVSA